MFVEDAADGVARAAAPEAARGGCFNLCTGVETTVRDAAALVARIPGGTEVQVGARPPIPGEIWRTSGDPGLARDVLGWERTLALVEGLVRTIHWFSGGGAQLSAYRGAQGGE